MRILLTFTILTLFTARLHAAEEINFGSQIQTIFLEHCAKCHGENKDSGGLRLHTVDSINEYGADYLLAPSKPDESEILRRISLPPDDESFMPKEGRPLAPDQIALIRSWIEQGADMSLAAVSGEANNEQAEEPKVEPATPEAIDRLRAAGAQVLAMFSGSPMLRVSFAYAPEPVGDEQVAFVMDVAQQVAWLNLTRTELTDAGTAPLATLENLTHLHLENTAITDQALMHLEGLQRLEYLNVYGTQVTDAGLQYLKEMNSLKSLYLWQTGVSYDAAMALQESISGLEVNLGWNHPEVVKARITKELERVTKQAEEATHREETARMEKEMASERKAALEKELAELLGETPNAEEGADAESKPAEDEKAEPVEDEDKNSQEDESEDKDEDKDQDKE